MFAYEWSGPLELGGIVIFCAFFVVVLCMVFAPYFKGERVGRVDTERQPKGVPRSRRIGIDVRRTGGRRQQRANVRVACNAGGIRHVQELDQVMAAQLAELLDEAALEASGPPCANEIGKGEVGAIEVGVFRASDGKAWVGLTWRFEPMSTMVRTCVVPATARTFAQLVRIAGQPGERLADAKRNFWREMHRRNPGNEPGNLAP